MKAVTIKGFKKTGKTTTCEKVIEELVRRGYSVGSAKDTHFEGFAMDTPGRDSWRLGKAGASTVIISGPEETDILYQHRVEIKDLLDSFDEDFLVTEGDIGLPLPNIVTGKTVDDLNRRRDENTVCFSGIVSDDMTEHDGLPVIDGVKETERLVDLIEERSLEL